MISCPACGSSAISSEIKLLVNAEEAAQHFVLAEENKAQHEQLTNHIRSLWKKSECEIRQCTVCKLGFSWPFVGGDGAFYNLAYPHVDYPKKRWEWEKTVEKLAHLETMGKKGLEIGSGFGYFLDLVCPRFFRYGDMVAIEYNDVAAGRLREKGCAVFSQDIRDPKFNDYENTLDFVFMFQVLEHMDNIQVLFDQLKRITRKGAHLFIAVPNSMRTEFNEANKSLLDMPPNHISRWTVDAFNALADRSGFDLLEVMEEPVSFWGFIKQDIVYSHMRRSQVAGSLPNWVRSKPRSKGRRIGEALLALLYCPARFGVWVKALGRKNLGNAILVHMQCK